VSDEDAKVKFRLANNSLKRTPEVAANLLFGNSRRRLAQSRYTASLPSEKHLIGE